MTDQQRFLDEAHHIALYGLKGNKRGAAYNLLCKLHEYRSDLRITAVNLTGANMNGTPVVTSATDLMPQAGAAIIVLGPAEAHHAIKDAARGGIRKIWLLPEAETEANIDLAYGLGVDVIGGSPQLSMPGINITQQFQQNFSRLFKRG